MIAAKLILVYQGYWGDAVNIVYAKVELIDFRSNIQEMIANTTLALFVIFLGVGVMEEFVKFWIMRFIDHNHFKSIDDVIELAIISALGFAFFENVLYFINQWENVSATGFFAFALFRVTIVTMVHVLCSGVLGYYYGMAFFASPMLKIQKMKHKKHPILSWLKKVFRMKQAHVYHDELIMIGLFTSMVLHAIYDFVLSINIRVAGIPLYIPVMLLYFFGGYWFLMALLHKKDLDLKIGMVGTSVMPKEDFAKLLEEIEVIKERMQGEIEEPVEEFTKEEIYED
jgi:RsiW-degrading membrane proteinase PrsW (M82 family)